MKKPLPGAVTETPDARRVLHVFRTPVSGSRRRMMSFCLLCASVVLPVVAGGALPPEPADLFNRHFAASGGREVLAAINGGVVKGTVREAGETREFTLLVKSPGMILLTLRDAKGRISRQGRDPQARFWQQDSKGVRDLEEQSAADLAAMSRPFHLAGLVELSSRLADSVCETDHVSGRTVFAVGRKANRGPRVFPRLLFDAETGLLAGFGRTRFADYGEFKEGIKVPHSLRQVSRSYKVDSVEFMNDLPDKGFERPGGSGDWAASLAPSVRVVPSHTQISAPGRLEIVRRPPPAPANTRRLKELPQFDPASGRHMQVPLIGADLQKLELSDRLEDLLHADFSTATLWPAGLPDGFDPGKVLELGKDPGLNVRRLHVRGITGKGVGIGIIDFALLTEHREYADRLRLYEEVHTFAGMPAHMHGTAVSSIALGKTCGVAPGADLYFVSVSNGGRDAQGRMAPNWTGVAQAVNRLLDVNALLAADRRIRVVSLSMGWTVGEKGFDEISEAVARAKRENVFILSTSLRDTHALWFDGLGRGALADPNDFQSYGPGSWWAARFWSGEMRFKPGKRLCAPMDARTTAGPEGPDSYIHYDNAGWSWTVPWIAGLYALACQVRPDITPEAFWSRALKTGRTATLRCQDEEIPFGTIADPVALMEALASGPES